MQSWGGASLDSFHSTGFTLTELVVVMVVITLIVLVTLPISRNKMKKADYFSYYMGYITVRDISANIMPNLFAGMTEGDSDCHFKLNGTCYGAPFSPTPLTRAECIAQKSDLGIQSCISYSTASKLDTDYWAGAVKQCGGVNNMPTAEQLAGIANYIYNTDQVKANLDVDNLIKDVNKASLLGSGLIIWSNEEVSGNVYFRTFYDSITEWAHSAHTVGYIQAMCVLNGSKDDSDNALTLCERILDTYNIAESACSVSIPAVKTKATSGDFSGLTPHITLSNGLKIYIGTEYEEISDLSDSISEDDRSGFILYLDVNGKSGKTKLYEDVFPYYLLRSGKIVPAYNPALVSGANNKDHMSINVLYDDYSNDKREVKFLLKDANFRRASCATGYVTSSKYCGDKVKYDKCNSIESDCRFMIKQPIKIF